jgi:ATPase subunit of ABC transporter with duplicated ATPase domains
MLTISQVTKSFGGRTLFADASLQINPGDRIGLIGPNGAGKSTLFSLVLGDNSPDEGSVNLQRGRTVGFLPQESAPSGEETVLQLATSTSAAMTEAYATLRAYPSEDSAEHHEAIATFVEHDGYNLEAKAKRILAGLAFRETDFHVPARTMSGGWIMRAHLARLLVMEPDLLMLDEPTNHLDLEMRESLTMALAQFDGTLILVSHDRHLLRSTADEFILVADGKVEPFNGDLDDYRQWLEQRTRAAARQAAKGAAQSAPKVAMPVAAVPAETPKPQPAKPDEARPKGGQRQKSDTAGQRKPIEREIAKLEQEIERLTTEKVRLDAQLGDPDLYLPPRAAELSAALARSAEVGARLEAAETDWMARQETLTRIAQA